MTASGAKLTESGFNVPGVLMTVLLMTYPPNASCQAGGDVTTRRQVRERPPAGSFGHAPILPVDDFSRYVHTSRSPRQEEITQLPRRYRTMCHPARPYRRRPPKRALQTRLCGFVFQPPLFVMKHQTFVDFNSGCATRGTPSMSTGARSVPNGTQAVSQ